MVPVSKGPDVQFLGAGLEPGSLWVDLALGACLESAFAQVCKEAECVGGVLVWNLGQRGPAFRLGPWVLV